MAAIDVAPDGDAGYTYRLRPDWRAIIAHLAGVPGASELIAWMEEQVSVDPKLL